MSFTDIFLLLIFTVLCGILLALWRIREQLERMIAGSTALTPGAIAATSSAATSSATSSRPPAA